MKKNIHSTGIYLFIHLFDKYLLSIYYVLDALPGADDTATTTKDTSNRGVCLRLNMSI